MIAVDTNIIVRFFVNDDDDQSNLAIKLFREQESIGGHIFIANIVLVELVWVLKKGYNVEKEDIIKSLRILLSNTLFYFEDIQLLKETIEKYQKESADFADYLIGEIGQKYNAKTTYTFDKKARKDNNFTILN
ncbi:MAG: PIN domain-containing protein [Fidelibacterota bacterium]